MENSPQLLPDFTLVYQLIIFFMSYFVMRELVFKPYLQLLRLRKEKTVGLREKALEAQARASKLRGDYETFIAAERKKVAGWTDEERRKTSEEEKGIIQEARTSVSQELDVLRKKIDREVETARKQLQPQVVEYSSNIATKLVGRKIDASNFSRESEAGTETSPTF